MSDLGVTITAAVSISVLSAASLEAHSFGAENMVFVAPIAEPYSVEGDSSASHHALQINSGLPWQYHGVGNRSAGWMVADDQVFPKPFKWPWAPAAGQDNPTKRRSQDSRSSQGGRNGSGGTSGQSNNGSASNSSGSSNSAGGTSSGTSSGSSSSSSGNMGGGTSNSGGNMGGGASSSGNM